MWPPPPPAWSRHWGASLNISLPRDEKGCKSLTYTDVVLQHTAGRAGLIRLPVIRHEASHACAGGGGGRGDCKRSNSHTGRQRSRQALDCTCFRAQWVRGGGRLNNQPHQALRGSSLCWTCARWAPRSTQEPPRATATPAACFSGHKGRGEPSGRRTHTRRPSAAPPPWAADQAPHPHEASQC